MDIAWKRRDTSYTTEDGIASYTEWFGIVEGETNTMSLMAGEGKQSIPNTSMNHHDDYTAVQVRAYRNSDGKWFWLQELDQCLMEQDIGTVEALWGQISAYSGDPSVAYQTIV